MDQREAVEAFLSSGIVELRIAGVRTHPGEPFKPAETVPVHAGDPLEIAVEVRNARPGHQFPTGTVDSNEAWLSAIVTDANGRTLAALGQTDSQGRVPTDAIRFGTRFVDAAGNFTDRRNTTTDAVSVAEDTVIPIRGRRTVFVPITIPVDASPPFAVNLSLSWRKYSPAFIRWVFDGRDTPPLPVTTLASLRLSLPTTAALPEALHSPP